MVAILETWCPSGALPPVVRIHRGCGTSLEKSPVSVLHASVVLKWFVTEDESAKAIKLRHQFVMGERSIIVPDLLFECANALNLHYS